MTPKRKQNGVVPSEDVSFSEDKRYRPGTTATTQSNQMKGEENGWKDILNKHIGTKILSEISLEEIERIEKLFYLENRTLYKKKDEKMEKVKMENANFTLADFPHTKLLWPFILSTSTKKSSITGEYHSLHLYITPDVTKRILEIMYGNKLGDTKIYAKTALGKSHAITTQDDIKKMGAFFKEFRDITKINHHYIEKIEDDPLTPLLQSKNLETRMCLLNILMNSKYAPAQDKEGKTRFSNQKSTEAYTPLELEDFLAYGNTIGKHDFIGDLMEAYNKLR